MGSRRELCMQLQEMEHDYGSKGAVHRGSRRWLCGRRQQQGGMHEDSSGLSHMGPLSAGQCRLNTLLQVFQFKEEQLLDPLPMLDPRWPAALVQCPVLWLTRAPLAPATPASYVVPHVALMHSLLEKLPHAAAW